MLICCSVDLLVMTTLSAKAEHVSAMLFVAVIVWRYCLSFLCLLRFLWYGLLFNIVSYSVIQHFFKSFAVWFVAHCGLWLSHIGAFVISLFV